MEERVENIFNEYIDISLNQYQIALGEEQGFVAWSQNLYSAFDKIKRRLGGQRFSEIVSLLDKAIDQQKNHNDTHLHKAWIEALLVQYYDPMYDYQVAKKMDRLIFKGRKSEIESFLTEYTQSSV